MDLWNKRGIDKEKDPDKGESITGYSLICGAYAMGYRGPIYETRYGHADKNTFPTKLISWPRKR